VIGNHHRSYNDPEWLIEEHSGPHFFKGCFLTRLCIPMLMPRYVFLSRGNPALNGIGIIRIF